MPQKKPAVAQFLDLEAVVDREHEDDSTEDEFDKEFIDDYDLDIDYEPRPMDIDHAAQNNIFEQVIKEKTGQEGQGSGDSEIGIEERSDVDPQLQAIVQSIVDMGDSPCWRVACKPKMEGAVGDMLIQQSQISGCSVHPTLHTGWLYVQGKLDTRIHAVLSRMPGVLRNRSGVIIHPLTRDEMLQIHNPCAPDHDLAVSQWVRIKDGPYKDDPAVVIAVDEHSTDVVVIPRVNMSKKRKRCRPSPALFQPDEFKKHRPAKSIRQHSESNFSVGSFDFQCGLLVRTFGLRSLTVLDIKLTSLMLQLFEKSQHPIVKLSAKIPKLVEWCLDIGDEVIIPRAQAQAQAQAHGIIVAQGVDFVEVKLDNGELVRSGWKGLRKAVGVGEYVEVTHGVQSALSGWIVDINEDHYATIIQAEGNESGKMDIEEMVFHVNRLRVTVPPTIFIPPSRVIDSVVKEYIPWRGTKILVTKKQHAYKGYYGYVVDITRHSSNSQQCIKLVIQLDGAYNPNTPYPRIHLDSEDVVEASTGLLLKWYNLPGSNFVRNLGPLPLQPIFMPIPSPYPLSNPSTTITTPAWDPGASTPLHQSDSQPLPAPIPLTAATSSTPEPPLFQLDHALLDRRLMDIHLKVFVTDGQRYKNSPLSVNVIETDGQLSFVHKVFNKWVPLKPEWVKPAEPNISRDNSLLVVTNGSHTGLFVRRIDNVRIDDKDVMFLAVVRRLEGKRDELTPDTLYLPPSDLCICVESDKEKKLNKGLMDILRRDAREGRLR
ncbi:hypothetical protein CVT24_005888 [Panaeolus cyanescens]|uniref:KOW domain-containing protein n=1 Tax=Panaeolus cyanescens TaxID=181874 RepID=A0A409YEX0_9AGAR|nr:hypothetical protein CVT24_005888 [Panaeolus cyanescens]